MKKFPIFLVNGGITDWWKIESESKGHFIRNMSKDGQYCYQSNDVKEGEIELLLSNIGHTVHATTELQYLAAVEEQMKRNQNILLRLRHDKSLVQ